MLLGATLGLVATTTPTMQAATTATPGVLGTAAATTCSTQETPVSAKTFTIDSASSTAAYHAHEQLASIGDNEAIGKTNAIIGQIHFDQSGMPVACSRFDVDLRTLKSDEARRDNYLYNNTLETEQYPLATFILTKVEGLDQPLSSDKETTFTLIGNLTMHGVTKEVAWQATAKLDGETLTGNATTTFQMPDFNITPPKVGPVLGINETVKLVVDITAKQAS